MTFMDAGGAFIDGGMELNTNVGSVTTENNKEHLIPNYLG